MNYVTLGKTGLKAAVVSFGGIPIQRADGANTKAVVDKLEEYGINYIDTARGYTVSEEYLGAALEGRRDKFILATKSMSRDAASMAADVETSLRNLRTGYIDLYQLHNLPEKDIEKVFGPGGAYEALTAAREAGKIGQEQYMAFQREVEETRATLTRYETELAGLNTEQDRLATNTDRLNKLFQATGTNVDDYADVLGNRLVTAIKNGSASADQLKLAIEKSGNQPPEEKRTSGS